MVIACKQYRRLYETNTLRSWKGVRVRYGHGCRIYFLPRG